MWLGKTHTWKNHEKIRIWNADIISTFVSIIAIIYEILKYHFLVSLAIYVWPMINKRFCVFVNYC